MRNANFLLLTCCNIFTNLLEACILTESDKWFKGVPNSACSDFVNCLSLVLNDTQPSTLLTITANNGLFFRSELLLNLASDYNFELLNVDPLNVLKLNFHNFCKPNNKLLIFDTTSSENLYFTTSVYSTGNEETLEPNQCQFQDIFNKLITTVTSLCQNFVWIKVVANYWNSKTYNLLQLVMTPRKFYTGNTHVLFNQTLKIVTVATSNNAPFIVKNDEDNTSYDGTVFRMLQKLSEELHFKYNIFEAPDHHYGSLINGSWDGMIGILKNGNADLAIAPFTITYDRSTAIHFCEPFFLETYSILTNVEKNTRFKFFAIFSRYVWFAVLSTAIFSAVYIVVVNYVSPVPQSDETLGGSTWYIYSGLVGQCVDLCLVAWSCRQFTVAWRLFAFILITVYVGKLTSVLISESSPLPFKDLESLADAVGSNQYQICVEPGAPFTEAILASGSDRTDLFQLKNFLNKNTDSMITWKCVDKLLQSTNSLAFISETTYLKSVQAKNCQKLQSKSQSLILLDDQFFPAYFSFATPKDSQYNSLFSKKISEMVEQGLVDTWNKNFSRLTNDSICDNSLISSTDPLGLPHMLDVFYAFLYAMVFTSIVFCVELAYGIVFKRIVEKRLKCLDIRKKLIFSNDNGVKSIQIM